MLRDVIVADVVRHAEAMLKWLRLSPENWEAAAYCQPLSGVYQNARLIVPISGDFDEAHRTWIKGMLHSRVTGTITLLKPSRAADYNGFSIGSYLIHDGEYMGNL